MDVSATGLPKSSHPQFAWPRDAEGLAWYLKIFQHLSRNCLCKGDARTRCKCLRHHRLWGRRWRVYEAGECSGMWAGRQPATHRICKTWLLQEKNDWNEMNLLCGQWVHLPFTDFHVMSTVRCESLVLVTSLPSARGRGSTSYTGTYIRSELLNAAKLSRLLCSRTSQSLRSPRRVQSMQHLPRCF